MPTAADLPADLYIVLSRVDFHCIWVSPAVLALLPNPPPVPAGGSMPAPGVLCDTAMDQVLALMPAPTAADQRRHLAAAQASLHSFGIVGMHDAGVLARERALYAEPGALSMRVYAMVECDVRNTFCAASKLASADGMLTVEAVKLYADGALGSWGAALLAPYADAPTNGTMLIDAAALAAVVGEWAAAGWVVCVHAIGDAANRAALDAVQAARPGRFRIEHAQIVAPADAARMRALGVTPSIQPTHATSDMYYAAARLGEERVAERAYRMQSFVRAGLRPVLGSDFPVEPPSVLRGIYAAVTRRDPNTGKGVDGGVEGWHSEEALSVREALEGFTRNVAAAAGMEGKAGVVKAGAWADWVVLSHQVLADGDVEWLRDGEVVMETRVAGRKVYQRG